jgi:hypothetical protein
MKTSIGSTDRVKSSKRERLQNPKEMQYDEYDGDNDQSMDPIAGAREAGTYIPTEKAEQP